MDRRRALKLLAGSGLAIANWRAGAQFYTPRQDLRGHWQLDPDPSLPNVLILGDSISIGYTLDVRRLLRSKANVMRPIQPDGRTPENCGNTVFGLEHLSSWLGKTRWDAIHFNWGLHDLCYYRSVPARSTANKVIDQVRDKIHGKQAVPLPEYKRNLSKLVATLQHTGASLIWASTTMVPQSESGRYPEDVVKYNEAAREIMAAGGIRIDDLYRLTNGMPIEEHRASNNVHYTKRCYAEIARQVASVIEASLGARRRI